MTLQAVVEVQDLGPPDVLRKDVNCVCKHLIIFLGNVVLALMNHTQKHTGKIQRGSKLDFNMQTNSGSYGIFGQYWKPGTLPQSA